MVDPGRSPPGLLPAHLVLSHFLFDSWVHEYDLMRPRRQVPPIDRREAEVVVRYLVGVATLQAGRTTPLALRLRRPDLLVGVWVAEGPVQVAVGSAPKGAPAVAGDTVDVVDRMTGRRAGPLHGDRPALAVLDALADVLGD